MDTRKLHEQVWTRFIRMPYCHIMDCADVMGNAVIPTGEECQKGLPTVVGWTTPIADGAFFGGLYLYGLCERYDREPQAKLREEIVQLAEGLFLLCDISKVDGFVARGVAQDGVSHYPVSSTDQFAPWVLGLWRLMHSSAADEALCRGIRLRLTRALKGLMAAGWDVPTEWPGVSIGEFSGKDWRGVAMLLFLAMVACELGLISGASWMALANECPADSIFTRREIVANGYAADMIRHTNLIQFWIAVCAQIGLRYLIEFDVDHEEEYRRGLHANAVVALEFLSLHTAYMAGRKPFVHDWRKILPEVGSWTTPDEAMKDGERLNVLWATTYNPGRNPERGPLAQCLFGAWIAIMDTDSKVAEQAYRGLCRAIEEIDWAGVQHSYAFAAEAAVYCWESFHGEDR